MKKLHVHTYNKQNLYLLTPYLSYYKLYVSTTLQNLHIKQNILYSHFIYTILATVCTHLPDTVIAVEEEITGLYIKAHGRFEFMIKVGDIKICIVEAKKENIRHGIVQGLTGSEVIAELGDLRQSLCIVTSYKEWLLYKSNDANISRFFVTLKWKQIIHLCPQKIH